MSNSQNLHIPVVITGADGYRQWLSQMRPWILCESGKAFPFAERHLQCIWYDPALRPAPLPTQEGECVTVLDPGSWNLEAGPDFLGAELLIEPEKRRIKGDVEIHIHPSDWVRHNHAADPRYHRVVAHITYFPAPSPPRGLPSGVVQIALQPMLERQATFRMDRIDVSAYPHAARLPPCPCAALLQQQPPPVEIDTLLAAAGAHRIEQKASDLKRQISLSDIQTVLYRNTMRTLGYKHNEVAFLRLADAVPLDVLQQHGAVAGYALLMGRAGLLPPSPPTDAPAEARHFIRLLWDAWWPLQAQMPKCPDLSWSSASMRPANHPARRLAIAALLFSRPNPWQKVRDALLSNAPPKALACLLAPSPPLDFWCRHTGLPGTKRTRTTALMGPARMAAWLNNTLLPMLAATDTVPIQSVLASLIPEESNSVLRQMATRLLGRDHNPARYNRSGLLQQGLLQLYTDFCRDGCRHCHLLPALQTVTHLE